jgi:hypothetical protein
MVAALKNLRKDTRMSESSDRQMSQAWLLVYIVPLIVGVIATIIFSVLFIDVFSSIDPVDPYNYSFDSFPLQVTAALTLIGLVGLINVAVSIVFLYFLVNRRWTHFKRQKFIYDDIIAAIGSLPKPDETDVDVISSSLERTIREARAEEIDKSAILWSILSAFIPFVQLYVYYFLMNDFYRHEKREDGFWTDTSKALNTLGVNFSVPRRIEAMPHRNFVQYLILLIVTVGLFGVYWIFVLIKYPNEHFKYHIETENLLISSLESAQK